MSRFGIKGEIPDPTVALSGMFDPSDQINLTRDGNWGNKIAVEILCVGGGGGGGGPTSGGGGAGGYRQFSVGMLTGIEYTVQVGGGGSGHWGGGESYSGGSGGSGIVILRTLHTASASSVSPTTDGSFNIYSFTSSGTITL